MPVIIEELARLSAFGCISLGLSIHAAASSNAGFDSPHTSTANSFESFLEEPALSSHRFCASHSEPRRVLNIPRDDAGVIPGKELSAEPVRVWVRAEFFLFPVVTA